MNYEIYAFGSITRGEISPSSDVDILVIDSDGNNSRFPGDWSVYSRKTIEMYYRTGRLFAWHLHLEAVRIYPKTGTSFLSKLGAPSPYASASDDISDLRLLLEGSISELQSGTPNQVYELGLVYTAIRDIAMAASWSILGSPSFSRYAPYEISPTCPLPRLAYEVAMNSRHAATRGAHMPLDYDVTTRAVQTSPILEWVESVRTTSCQTRS
jgi:hypothetical protein